MVLCLMVGCGNKTGKKSKEDIKKAIKYYCVPGVHNHQLWNSAISRADLREAKLESDRVCSEHL